MISKEYTPEEYHDVRDEMVFDDDFKDMENFWFRINNLRYQLHKIKLAKLECTMESRLADIYIDIFTDKIKRARV